MTEMLIGPKSARCRHGYRSVQCFPNLSLNNGSYPTSQKGQGVVFPMRFS